MVWPPGRVPMSRVESERKETGLATEVPGVLELPACTWERKLGIWERTWGMI